MQIITLTGILLSSPFWRNVVGDTPPASAPPPPTYTLKAVDTGKCEAPSKDCSANITAEKLTGCRVNAKQTCTFDLTMVHNQIDVKPSQVKGQPRAAVIKTEIAELNGWIVKSVQIKVDKNQLKGAKLAFKAGEVKDLANEDVTKWTVFAKCAIKGETDTFTCEENQAEKLPKGVINLSIFKTGSDNKSVAVAIKEDKFEAVVTLTRKGIHSIPKLSEKEAIYSLKAEKCETPKGDCAKPEGLLLAAAKKCVKEIRKKDCKVISTIALTAPAASVPVESGLINEADKGLAVVAIDPSVFPRLLIDAAKLNLMTVNFNITKGKIATGAGLLINDNLKDFTTGLVTGATVDTTGNITSDISKTQHDFSHQQYIYLNKGVKPSESNFTLALNLTGDPKTNNPPPKPPIYTLSGLKSKLTDCGTSTPTLPECTVKENAIANVTSCINAAKGKHCKEVHLTWTYKAAAKAVLPDANGKFPIVYFKSESTVMTEDFMKAQPKLTITEISIDPAINDKCYTKDSEIFSGDDLEDLSNSTTSSVTEVKDKKTFQTTIAAEPDHYYQIRPLTPADGTKCDHPLEKSQMSFTLTAVLDLTTTSSTTTNGTTRKGMTGFINGGLFLTFITLLLSL